MVGSLYLSIIPAGTRDTLTQMRTHALCLVITCGLQQYFGAVVNAQRDISRITTNNYQRNTVSAYWTWLQSIDQQATMRIPQTGVFFTLCLVMEFYFTA